jgi:hypothetical protein
MSWIATLHPVQPHPAPGPVDIFELPVHPTANIFPMLGEEELADLAEDIEAKGLRHPLVVGLYEGEPHLIDGRNRREACRLAGVEPAYRFLDPSEDITDFIYSENIARRHMTTGQKVMAAAVMFPDAAKLKRKGSGSHDVVKTEQLGVAKRTAENLLSQARTVLAESPETAKMVLSGEKQLSVAYAEAVEARRVRSAEAQRIAILQRDYPDLFQRFKEGYITEKQLDTLAEAEYKERKYQEQLIKDRRNLLYHAFSRFIDDLGKFNHEENRIYNAKTLVAYRKEFEFNRQDDLEACLSRIEEAVDGGLEEGIRLFLQEIRKELQK